MNNGKKRKIGKSRGELIQKITSLNNAIGRTKTSGEVGDIYLQVLEAKKELEKLEDEADGE